MTIVLKQTKTFNGMAFNFTDADGTKYQLVWRPDSAWLFGYKPVGGRWTKTTVADGIPQCATLGAAIVLAHGFANSTDYFSPEAQAERVAERKD